MTIERALQDDGLLRQVFALRYRAFRGVTRAGAPAAPDGLFQDEVDVDAVHYVVRGGGGAPVGAFRTLYLRSMSHCAHLLHEWSSRFDLPGMENEFDRIEIAHVGRLVVDRSHRSGGSVAASLLTAATGDLVASGVRAIVADCSAGLLPFYALFGCFQHAPPFVDPIFGPKTPIASVLCDAEMLRAVRSPLLGVLQHCDDAAGRQWAVAYHGEHRADAIRRGRLAARMSFGCAALPRVERVRADGRDEAVGTRPHRADRS
jgi:hypothetical protein